MRKKQGLFLNVADEEPLFAEKFMKGNSEEK